MKIFENTREGPYLTHKVDKKCPSIILSRPGMASEPKIPFWGSIRPLFDPGDPPVGGAKK